MARRLDWSDVRGGLIATAVIVGISAATLKYARVGALRGETVRLFAVVAEARGILKGSEVWLSGQKIGRVHDIHFRSPSIADTTSRLLLELEVMEKYRGAMRRDAEAQVRAGGSVIGAVVVYLSPGTASAPVIRDGDTIRTRPQADVEAATAQFSAAAKQFPAILADVKTIRGQLQSSSGTMGAVLNEGLGAPLARTGAQVSRMRSSMSGGRGSLGRIMSGGLGGRAQRVMARADSVRALVGSSNTSLGRFRRDSTLMAEVADIRNELTIVRALLAEPRGTAGRMMQDSAVTSALGEAQREMGLIMADIKKHPMRYSPF